MNAPAESPRSRTATPGTQPEGIHNEREAASYVRDMFSRIAPRYDLLNHLLSLSLDKVWRRRTARRFRHILTRADAHVLDLCCGTGDLSLILWGVAQQGMQPGTQNRGGATVWGSDFAHPMLVRAVEKAARAQASNPGATPICFTEADAMQTPFDDASFDLATAAFGFRNLANYETGLREIYRVLRPGGEAGILEFAAPRNAFIGAMYRLYFTQIVPRVGGSISGNRAAYAYLPVSVDKFPEREELHAQMSAIGFRDIHTALWTFGIVALHTAKKA